MLPSEFYEEVETKRVRGLWTLVLTLLLTGLGNLIFTDWLRAESSRRYVTLLQEKVKPIIAIRDFTLEKTTTNQNLERWIEQVESARPDDSLLQALAAVTTAVRPYSYDLFIDSIDIRVPSEVPATAKSKPESSDTEPRHTAGKVTIEARVSQSETAQQIVESLAQQVRLRELDIRTNPTTADRLQIQILATPLATRIQP